MLMFPCGQHFHGGKGKLWTQAWEVREGFLEEMVPGLSLERWVWCRQEDKGCLHQEQPSSLQVSSMG